MTLDELATKGKAILESGKYATGSTGSDGSNTGVCEPVLDRVRNWLQRFICPMEPRDLDLLTLWSAHTHLVNETYDQNGLTDATEFDDVKAIAQIYPQIKEITAAGETPEQLALHRLATLTERAGFGAHPHLLREREANVVLPTWSRVRGHDSHRREGGR